MVMVDGEWIGVDETGGGSTENTHGWKTKRTRELWCTHTQDQDIDPRTRCCVCGVVVWWDRLGAI